MIREAEVTSSDWAATLKWWVPSYHSVYATRPWCGCNGEPVAAPCWARACCRQGTHPNPAPTARLVPQAPGWGSLLSEWINGLGKMVMVMMMGWRRYKKRVVVSPLPLPLTLAIPLTARYCKSHHTLPSLYMLICTVSGHVGDVAAKAKLLEGGEAVLPHLQTRTSCSPCYRKQPLWGTYGKDRKTTSIQMSWICRFIFGGC